MIDPKELNVVVRYYRYDPYDRGIRPVDQEGVELTGDPDIDALIVQGLLAKTEGKQTSNTAGNE